MSSGIAMLALVNVKPVFWIGLVFVFAGPILLAITPRKTTRAGRRVDSFERRLRAVEDWQRRAGR